MYARHLQNDEFILIPDDKLLLQTLLMRFVLGAINTDYS